MWMCFLKFECVELYSGGIFMFQREEVPFGSSTNEAVTAHSCLRVQKPNSVQIILQQNLLFLHCLKGQTPFCFSTCTGDLNQSVAWFYLLFLFWLVPDWTKCSHNAVPLSNLTPVMHQTVPDSCWKSSSGSTHFWGIVTDVAPSEHYCAFFEMIISADTCRTNTEVIRKCYIDENTCTMFSQAAVLSVSVNDLVNSFSSRVASVIGNIDPMQTKVISGKKKAPWRNASLLRAQKRAWSQAELRLKT